MADPQYGYAHQKRRTEWVRLIARLGGVQCACAGQCTRHVGPCPVIITPDTPWHLGHGVPHALGGDGTDSAPWCEPCNLKDGSLLGHGTRPVVASRDWWA